MFLNPIIPAWLMAIVSILLLGIVLTLIFSQKRNLKGKIIKAVRFVLILVLLFVIYLRPMLPSAGKQEVIMNKIRSSKKEGKGFNAKTKKLENLIEGGVLDSSKVLRVSLENSISAASMILLIDCTIVDEPEEKKCCCGHED